MYARTLKLDVVHITLPTSQHCDRFRECKAQYHRLLVTKHLLSSRLGSVRKQEGKKQIRICEMAEEFLRCTERGCSRQGIFECRTCQKAVCQKHIQSESDIYGEGFVSDCNACIRNVVTGPRYEPGRGFGLKKKEKPSAFLCTEDFAKLSMVSKGTWKAMAGVLEPLTKGRGWVFSKDLTSCFIPQSNNSTFEEYWVEKQAEAMQRR